ncbi:MAG TPA: prephenate dehydrogenase [Prolixibacteraceae bacterium]|nr:prephenate dehydrogenase [Prolixibacteraceae bacterium]HPS11723.1 prephenate dehydrogenase [Prolixibacteraceae bacterium]
MKITIIGLGLIGGSLAIDLRKTGFATTITGVDKNLDHLRKASQLGLIDREATFEEGVKNADVVIVAIPVDKIAETMPAILDLIDPSTSVTDVGSTKDLICRTVENHPRRGNYVPAHPMSGTENSGPEAAIEGLFQGKICIICDQEKIRPQHLALIEKMYHTIGLDIAYMTSDEQDHSTAHVSHLPHATSFALANTVLDANDRAIIFDLASGGFQSTVRLAKSSPEMWGPIFRQNSHYVVESLNLYIKHLEELKQSIEEDDNEKMMSLMKNANRIREILDGESTELVRKEQTTAKLYTK